MTAGTVEQPRSRVLFSAHRHELIDEYRRASGGSFHIITFSRLLEMFEASADAVAEIRKEEVTQARYRPKPKVARTYVRQLNSRTAVEKWFRYIGIRYCGIV